MPPPDARDALILMLARFDGPCETLAHLEPEGWAIYGERADAIIKTLRLAGWRESRWARLRRRCLQPAWKPEPGEWCAG